MTLKTIYIARHGYRSNWLPPPHPPSPTGIDSDPPLLEHGDDQALELAHYIESLANKPQMIVSSPFYRCIQTADPISKILDIPIALDRGIGEWFKLERNVHPVPGDLKLLSKFFGNLDHSYKMDQIIVPSPTGEDELMCMKRCQDFLAGFIPFINEKFPHIESIILVTHAATKIALGMSLLGYETPRDLLKNDHILENETRLRAGSCSLDRFEFANDKWNLTMNGNVEFLSKGEEMNWSFEYGFEAGSDEDIKARQERSSRERTAELEEEFDEVYVTIDIPSDQLISSTNSSQYYTKVLGDDLSKSNGHNTVEATSTTITSDKPNQNHLTNLYSSSSLQYSGLENQNPFFLINQQLYKGDYRKLNGTELIVNDNGDVIAKTKDRVLLHKGDFVKKELGQDSKLKNDDPARTQILQNLPESLQRTNNSNLLDKLILAKKLEMETNGAE